MRKLLSLRVPNAFLKAFNKVSGKGTGARLARSASASFILQTFGIAITFIAHVILARVMGVEHYGIYSYVFTWLNVLLLVAKLGTDTTLLKYIAIYNAQEEWSVFKGILQSTNRSILLTSLLVAGVASSLIWGLHNRLEAELIDTFYIACLTIPVLALTNLRQATLQGLRRITWALLPDTVLRPLLLIILLEILSNNFSQPVDAPIAMVLHLIAAAFSFIVGAYCLHLFLPENARLSLPEYRTKEWVGVALPLFLVSAMQVVLTQTDSLMLGMLVGTTKVGIYTTASRIATLLAFGLTAVNVVLAPMIAELYSSQKHAELQRMLTLSAHAIFAYTSLSGVGLIIFGNNLLALFGIGFSEGYPTLVILTLGQIVNALAGSVGFLMTMTGHQKEALYVVSISAGLNVVLNALLIPHWGAEGAATATALTTATWNVALGYYVRKHLMLKATVI